MPFLLLAALGNAATAQTSVSSMTYNDVMVAAPEMRNVLDATGTSYQITYDGIDRRITSFVAGGKTYVPTQVGQAVARRNGVDSTSWVNNPSQSTAWNAVKSANANDHTVSGKYLNTMDAVFTSRNILSGTENLFVNETLTTGNVANNVERMDFLFASGFAASADTGFSIFERGRGANSLNSGVNGGFRIAAVTGLDPYGVPNSFSDSLLIADDSYNNGGVGIGLASETYDVFRYANAGGPELDYLNNPLIGPQGIAGVYVRTTDLVSAGSTIYGYAVMGEDAPVSGSQLVNWRDSNFWLTQSGMSNDVDMVATGAVLFTMVPEPSSAVMIALGSLVLVTRRKRNA